MKPLDNKRCNKMNGNKFQRKTQSVRLRRARRFVLVRPTNNGWREISARS